METLQPEVGTNLFFVMVQKVVATEQQPVTLRRQFVDHVADNRGPLLLQQCFELIRRGFCDLSQTFRFRTTEMLNDEIAGDAANEGGQFCRFAKISLADLLNGDPRRSLGSPGEGSS
jgi:hypothetical protein